MKMPKDLKERWVAALRSGEYEQTKGTLYNPVMGGYCCLGVLELVAEGGVERDGLNDYPTKAFYDRNGILPGAAMIIRNLAWLNDRGRSFDEIADIIEADVLTTD